MQTTIEDLGTPLRTVEFCVVDLETTGGTAADLGITEIGAVKVRAGEVIGEFQTLVNPARPIPAAIAVLTGITDATVAAAPPLSAALPAFLEFAHGTVLVAHNAPYDMGYLRAAAAAHGYELAPRAVLDTARLSRAILGRGEVPNHKLATLAQHFRATTRPVHRALDDARATVDVLHGLMERIGSLGMTDLEDLLGYSGRVAESQRRKRHLADGLPHAPGVYLFADERGETLYVGTSKDIRGRVRTYFTASEQRTRMAEMVALAARVTPIVCASPLEAAVRELRLIAERKPRYNRRSRFPERGRWLKLTVEAAPRLSLVAAPRADLDTGAAYLGPLSSRTADDIKEVLQLATSIRTCTERLSPARPRTPCSLAELGRCCAPCTGPVAMDLYRGAAEAARRALRDDAAGVAESVMDRIRSLGAEQRYEEAGALLGKLRTFLRHADRTQQRQALADAGQIVAAEPEGGSWIIHVIRHGRLAGAVRSPVGADPRPAAHAAVATAEQVAPPTGPGAASLAEEADLILTWLARPGVRVIGVSGSWTLPLRAAARYRATLEEPPRVGSASGAPAGDSPDIAGSADSCGDLHPAGEDIARTA